MRSARSIRRPANSSIRPLARRRQQEVEQACALAWAAFDAYRETGLEARASFLEAIAAEILDARRRADRARHGRDRAAARPDRGRARPHRRPASAVRVTWCATAAGSMRGSTRRCPTARRCRAPDLRLRNIAGRAGGGVRRQQLPARLLGRRRRHRLGAGGGLSGGGQGASGASRHVGTGRARRCRRRSRRCGLPEGVFSLLFGAGNCAGRRAGGGSADQGGGLHRLARRRAGADAHRRGARRADPGLCRDEQHQPGDPVARPRWRSAPRRSARGSSAR